ncbi:MAG TPA: hypothetical protein VN851_01595 [Thermoanaerobaculia bacterium]|nr:hypothetical protein [Thermoanaerobaculia bacterium]
MPIDRFRSQTTRSAFFLAIALAALPAAGAEIDRIASFSAGGPPPCSDIGPDLAVQPGGSFLLTWQGSGCPNTNLTVRAQRFDAAGRPLSAAVDLWEGIEPRVAPLSDGGFVVATWFDRSLLPITFQGLGLHRLDGFGREVGEPMVVAADPDSFNLNSSPRLAVAPNGSVALVWVDDHELLRGQFFDASLHPISGAIFLSETLLPDQIAFDPDIAFQADGTALAVWTRSVSPEALQIFGRRFGSSGEPLSEAFPISRIESPGAKTLPHVSARPDGGWWVGWYSYMVSPIPGPPFETDQEVRIVRLGADGAVLGPEQKTDVLNRWFALGADPTGNLLLLGIGPNTLFGRLFPRDGAPPADPFTLSGSDSISFRESALADRSPAGFLAAWSESKAAPDLNLSGALLTVPCLEGKNAVCLGPESRYGVEVAWQNGAQSGSAKPLQLSDNVATFGLRNAADHDVTVLLSGPGLRDLTFAATTGAAIEIKVTDKTSGAVRTFTKSAGRFASGRFPNALPSGARLRVIEITRKMTTSLRDVSLNSSSRQGRRNLARGFNPSLAPEPTVGETCVPTRRALCLLGGRFRAELLAGQYPNPALAITRTDKSGAFALPRAPETPLVTLTMIDGRSSNGKFWVYLGGLTSSGYRVRITDLSTGAAKTYTNPVGRLDSRADRTAF